MIRLVFVGRLFQLFVLALPIFGQIEVGDKPPGHGSKRCLVIDGFRELPEIGSRFGHDLIPPQLDNALAAFRYHRPSELFPQHESDGVGQGRLLSMLHLGEAACFTFLFERVAQVLRDADHAPRSERFDSSEFHGIEKSACVLPLGCSCGVQPFVVVPDT